MNAFNRQDAGCPRCRLDLIRFTREVKLPRWTFAAGEEWHLPQCRYLADGSAEVGAGVAPRDSFTIVVVDEHRAGQCRCDGSFTDRRE